MTTLDIDLPVIKANEVRKPQLSHPHAGPIANYYGFFKTFYNGLRYAIKVTDRNGNSVIIPPSTKLREAEEFTIIDAYAVPREVKFDSDYIFNRTSENYAERRVLSESNEEDFQGTNTRKIVECQYVFTISTLLGNGGSIYHQETDTVITVIGRDLKAVGEKMPITHPFSHEGIELYSKRMISNEIKQNRDSSFIYTIRIVDNAGTYGKRFTVINNEVYSITPVKDTRVREGIYLVKSFSVRGDFSSHETEDCVYALCDSSDTALSLYRTYNDAYVTKERLTQIDLELKKATAELKQKQHEWDTQKQQYLREISELELLRAKNKERNEIHKEENKSNVEFLKNLPVIISAVGTIIVVALKVADSIGSSGGGGGSKK